MAVQVQGEGHRRNQYRLGKVCFQVNDRAGGNLYQRAILFGQTAVHRLHRIGEGVKVDILIGLRFNRRSVFTKECGDIVCYRILGAFRGQDHVCRSKSLCLCPIDPAALGPPAQSLAQLIEIGLRIVAAAKVIVPAVVGIHAVFRRIPESKNLGIALKIHIVALAIAAGIAVNLRTVDGDPVAARSADIDTAATARPACVAGNLTACKAQLSEVTVCPHAAAVVARIFIVRDLAAGHNERRGIFGVAAVDIYRAAGTGIALNDTTVHGEAGTLRRSAVVHIHCAGTIP